MSNKDFNKINNMKQLKYSKNELIELVNYFIPKVLAELVCNYGYYVVYEEYLVWNKGCYFYKDSFIIFTDLECEIYDLYTNSLLYSIKSPYNNVSTKIIKNNLIYLWYLQKENNFLFFGTINVVTKDVQILYTNEVIFDSCVLNCYVIDDFQIHNNKLYITLQSCGSSYIHELHLINNTLVEKIRSIYNCFLCNEEIYTYFVIGRKITFSKYNLLTLQLQQTETIDFSIKDDHPIHEILDLYNIVTEFKYYKTQVYVSNNTSKYYINILYEIECKFVLVMFDPNKSKYTKCILLNDACIIYSNATSLYEITYDIDLDTYSFVGGCHYTHRPFDGFLMEEVC
jgi:hypothetical protein